MLNESENNKWPLIIIILWVIFMIVAGLLIA